METRKWQDKDGNARYSTEIRVETAKNLSPRSGEQQEGPPESGGGYGVTSTGEEVPF
jgi:single-stranded DNA-binding protein